MDKMLTIKEFFESPEQWGHIPDPEFNRIFDKEDMIDFANDYISYLRGFTDLWVTPKDAFTDGNK